MSTKYYDPPYTSTLKNLPKTPTKVTMPRAIPRDVSMDRRNLYIAVKTEIKQEPEEPETVQTANCPVAATPVVIKTEPLSESDEFPSSASNSGSSSFTSSNYSDELPDISYLTTELLDAYPSWPGELESAAMTNMFDNYHDNLLDMFSTEYTTPEVTSLLGCSDFVNGWLDNKSFANFMTC